MKIKYYIYLTIYIIMCNVQYNTCVKGRMRSSIIKRVLVMYAAFPSPFVIYDNNIMYVTCM